MRSQLTKMSYPIEVYKLCVEFTVQERETQSRVCLGILERKHSIRIERVKK